MLRFQNKSMYRPLRFSLNFNDLPDVSIGRNVCNFNTTAILYFDVAEKNDN